MIGQSHPANTPKNIQIRGTFSNTSTVSMTDQMLKEMRSKPDIYNSPENVMIFLKQTCKDKIENSQTHGTKKNHADFFSKMKAHLATKSQADPVVATLMQALSELKRTHENLQTALTTTHLERHPSYLPIEVAPGCGGGSASTPSKPTRTLSTGIKEGTLSININSELDTILSNPTEAKKFLEDPVVQRRVLKGILRRKVVVEVPAGRGSDLISLLKTTVDPMLSAKDQADVLRVKKGPVDTLDVLLREHPQFIRFFTDPAAQLQIADAIRTGTFGKDPELLKAVAGKLAMFTAPAAQLQIAEAIITGTFGKDPEVLKAVAGKLAMFTAPAAQQRIAMAISRGKFGTDTDVLKAVAGKLAMFTYEPAQENIADAIRKGNFGKDTEVLKAVAGKLTMFTAPDVQLHIAMAISRGKFGIDTDVLEAVAGQLTMFTAPEAKWHIAWAISNGGFGKDTEVLKAVAGKLTMFTAPDAQLQIAVAIGNGKFGIDTDVLEAVAGQLDRFTDTVAHGPIALAGRHIDCVIRLGGCGSDPAKLKKLAEELPELMGENAPLLIAMVIQAGKFGTNPHLLKAVAGKLAIFREPDAQQEIALAIHNGRFGNDPEVLKVVAGKLAIFTEPDAQQEIALAIHNGRFGNDPEVLKAVAENLTMFTDPEAKSHIALAIHNGKFGNDPEVLKAVAEKLDIFTDRVSRRVIAWDTISGKFGTNPEVLKAGADEKTTRAELNRRLAAPLFVELLTGVGDEGVFKGYVLPLISAHLKSLAPEESQMKKLASQLNFAAEIECEEAALPIGKIKDRLATADNEVVIPYGMHKHAMLLKLKFTDLGLNVEIYNSGLGLDYHKHHPQPGVNKYNTCKEKFYPDMRPASPEFNTLLTNIVKYREFKTIYQSYAIFAGALSSP